MGRPDQFAKALFADETSALTGGALRWQQAIELPLTHVIPDGVLLVDDLTRLAALPAPWSLAAGHSQLVVDFKMQRDHADLAAFVRALHRRLTWVVKLHNDDSVPEAPVGMWVVHSHLPRALATMCQVQRLAPGCYRLHLPPYGEGMWIAANELPLDEALLPWLVLRSGEPLRDFVDWTRGRRPVAWLLELLKIVPMEYKHLEEYRRQLRENPDPEIQERERMLAEFFLDGMTPEQRLAGLAPEQRLAGLAPEQRLAGLAPEQRLAGLAPEQRLAGLPVELTALGGRLDEARRAVARVLERRGLGLTEAHRQAIASCGDLTTLERWLDQAVTAPSADDAVR